MGGQRGGGKSSDSRIGTPPPTPKPQKKKKRGKKIGGRVGVRTAMEGPVRRRKGTPRRKTPTQKLFLK